MDIMEKVNDIVKTITENKKLMDAFQKDPAATIKTILNNIDLDDEIMEKLVVAVKGKIDLDKAGSLLSGLKKLF